MSVRNVRHPVIRAGIVLVSAAVLLSGCSGAPSTPTGTPTASPTETASPTPSPTSTASEGRVVQDWAVPEHGDPFSISHPGAAPPPLPCLVQIEVGSHPEQDPPFDEIAFTFDVAFPDYEVEYVPELIAEGSGLRVELPGARDVLRVVFRGAQAHNESGESCVQEAPNAAIGFPVLGSYAQAGDFEGVVVFGLGLGDAGSAEHGAQPRIRVEELDPPAGDEAGYVVVLKIAWDATG